MVVCSVVGGGVVCRGGTGGCGGCGSGGWKCGFWAGCAGCGGAGLVGNFGGISLASLTSSIPTYCSNLSYTTAGFFSKSILVSTCVSFRHMSMISSPLSTTFVSVFYM